MAGEACQNKLGKVCDSVLELIIKGECDRSKRVTILRDFIGIVYIVRGRGPMNTGKVVSILKDLYFHFKKPEDPLDPMPRDSQQHL